MVEGPTKQVTWRWLVEREAPLLLPAAHDGLTAKLIERAGFKAYQVGGFALSGARHGFPDIDLVHYGEQGAGVRDIIAASSLPVMIDADDCYGDVKNVTRTIRGYERLGVSAIFFEDQVAPKRCGHMQGKEVIPAEAMASKVKAAVGARINPDLFLIARTDAIAASGLDEALRRAELYLESGADGLFIEGPKSVRQLERIGRKFKGVPKIANMLEGGGVTPILSPKDLHEMGFAMVLYPTSLIFRLTKTIERVLADMLAQRLKFEGEGVSFEEFEEIVGLPGWKAIEEEYGKG
jgi:2-methylisocitrate lyase-like PEP mutase family enzyme